MKNDPHICDMHVHTYLSDADPDQSPEVVCKAAAEAGVRCLSITDHDVRPMPEEHRLALQEANNITLIPGCEISSIYKGAQVHIGAHFLKPGDPYVEQIIAHNASQPHDVRLAKMIDKCQRIGVIPAYISIDQVVEEIKAAYPHSDHLAKRALVHFLVSKGYVQDRDTAYRLLAYGGPAFVDPLEDIHYVPMEEAIEAVARNSLATHNHLFYSRLDHNENCQMLKVSKAHGCQGLEVIYTHYLKDPHKLALLYRFHNEYDLLINCGSDRHDPSRPFMQGSGIHYRNLLQRQLELHGTTHVHLL